MVKLIHYRVAILAAGLLLLSAASAQFPPGGSNSLTGGGRPQPLTIAEAFPFFVSINDREGLSVSWQIAENHYLYRHQFEFALKSTAHSKAQTLAFSLPDGLKKRDQFFGEIEAYYKTVTATLKLDTDKLSGSTLVIRFQGCADWGFCYPAQSVEYSFAP